MVLRVVADVFIQAGAGGGPLSGGSNWRVIMVVRCVEQVRRQFCVVWGAQACS
jgi:hypothetical protein